MHSGVQSEVSGEVDPMNRIEFRLERELQFQIKGKHSRGTLVIGGLRRKEKTGDLDECWACAWSLAEIHTETAEICGEDPLDA